MRTLELLHITEWIHKVVAMPLKDDEKLSILEEIKANIPSVHRYPSSQKTLAILVTELEKAIAKYKKPEPKKVSTDAQSAKPKRTTRRKASAQKAEQGKPEAD